MSGNSFAAGLLWTLPGVLAGSMLVALLILRSVFRDQDFGKLAIASGLLALLPAIVVICIWPIAWRLGEASADDLEDDLFYSLPPIVGVSFIAAWPILRWLFPRETPAKTVIACTVAAQFACVGPVLAAIQHPWVPDFYSWYDEILLQAVFNAVTFLPEVLLLVLWLAVFVRHSESVDKSYVGEAWAALIVGFFLIVWGYVAASFWTSVAPL